MTLLETLTIDANTALILVAVIGVIGVISSGFLGPIVISWMSGNQRAAERALDRADRAEVARQVTESASLLLTEQRKLSAKTEEVAHNVEASNAGRDASLLHISKTTEATHAIVNSQRTVLLRALALMARARASDHPDNETLEEVARSAEKDLADNVRENADPATKAPLPTASGPIEVTIVNPEPVAVEVVPPPTKP